MKFFLIVGSLLITLIPSAFAVRTDKDRFQLLRDKMKVNTLMKPFEHDFILDIDLALSKKFVDVASDSGDFVDNNKSASAVADFLSKYNDTEYFLKAGLALGVPLPSFSIGSFKFISDVRGFAEAGASASITARAQDLAAASLGLVNNNSQSYIQIFAQQDFKYGLNIGYEYKNHIFGHLFLYKLDRWDRNEIVDATQLVSQDGDIVDLDKAKNTNHVLTTDFKIGYKKQEFKTYLSLEEVKVSTMSKSGDLAYGIKPLFHFHADYTWDLFVMDLTLFAGIMKRSSYDFDDGFYKGVLFDFNYFPIDASLILDNEFFTLQPKIDLWLLTLDYSFKKPINAKKDGFKSDAIHALNLRISI